MKYFLTALIVVFSQLNLFSQCSCTDCPVPIISNTTTQSDLTISGSVNDQLGVNGQALCQICLSFSHDAPNEFDFTLTSPSGTSVLLIGQTGFNVNQNVTFNICFVPCGQPAMPDPGFSAVFDSSEPWLSNNTYSGTYYPTNGCLESLSGNVNGNWNLTMTDFVGLDNGSMNDWNLVFADDTGLGCGGTGPCSPPPSCMAEAGGLSANPQPACPGATVNYSVAGFQTDPAYTQLLIITDANGLIQEINPNTAGTVTSNACEVLQLFSYNFDPTSGALPPSVGGNINQIDCNADCCDLESIPISFQDIIPPAFDNPPFSELFSCIDELTPALPLSWTDNCGSSGQAIPIESGNADLCTGGIFVRTWEAMDGCGNVSTHNQTITVLAAPAPDFLLPPPDITVSCDNVPLTPDQLVYTNFETGTCEITGFVDGQVSGAYNECGGTLFFNWADLDACGNPVTHQQMITVLPAATPTFINPPQDITISCNDIPVAPPNLTYSNFASGLCEFTGVATPLVVDNTSNCGGNISYLWEATTSCGTTINHLQVVTIDPAAEAVFINIPPDITMSCSNFSNNAQPLNYSNGETGACEIAGSVLPTVTGSTDPCGSVVLNVWTFTDDCGRTISAVQSITIEPSTEAVFINAPQDITLACADFSNVPQPLDYSNGESGGCEITGTVLPLVSGGADPCGSLVQNVWTYTDDCGRTISYIQNITIEPAPEAVFINPPQNLTLTCNNFSNNPQPLSYSNGVTGTCEISGTIMPVVTGDFDPCGSLIQNVWIFTDACGRVITNIQNITLDPAPPAIFIDPPADIILNCGDPFPTPADLNYSNGQTGVCAIEGTVTPTTLMPDATTQEITWTFSDPCSAQNITHVQVITQLSSPDISLNPASLTLCAGESYDLNTIAIIDANSSNPTITFHDATPADGSNELASTTITPLTNTTYYVLAVSSGCSVEIPFPVSVDAAPSAGMNGSGTFCFNPGANIDLFSYLTGSPDPGGNWSDLDVSGLDISNPANVDLNGLAGGIYEFEYSLGGTGGCPLSTAIVSLEILAEIQIAIDLVACSSDLLSYEVTVQTNGYTITSDFGVVNDLGGNVVLIAGIPVGQDIIITASDILNQCSESFPVTAPDCACDPVDPPVSTGDQTICFGDAIPMLMVTVGPGQIANWYDAATGGNLLLADNTSYQSAETLPGIYQYYVEAENTVDGCVSSTRTLIQLEILSEIQLMIEQVACSSDLLSYEVTVQTNGYAITSDFGVVNDLGGNVVLISGIPAGQDIIITASDNLNSCSESFPVAAPDCGCGQVDPPVNTGNQTICEGENIPELMVTLQAGQIANWYDAATAGNLLLANNTSYQPLVSAPGIYQYYAEAENTVDGCLSATRTLVELEIVAQPDIQLVVSPEICLGDDNGMVEIISSAGANYNLDGGTWGANTIFTNLTPDNYIAYVQNTNDCVNEMPFTVDAGLELTVSDFQSICDDNNTSTDPADDTYAISFIVNNNMGASGSFTIMEGATSFGTGNYGELITLNVDALGQSFVLAISDAVDNCSTTINVGPLNSCSTDCELIINSLTFNCEDNGTSTDPTDDFYIVEFNAMGLNNGASTSFELLVDGNSEGLFPYDLNNSINLPADGSSPILTFIDNGNNQCQIQQQIGPLVSCSTVCELIINTLTFDCANNGTSTDPTDDFYTVEFNASGVNNGGSTSFELLVGGISEGLFSYDQNNSINLPADGSSPNLTFVDNLNSQCQIQQLIGPLTSCSTDCELIINSLTFNCQDNGTTTDPTDDFYIVEFNASGVNNGGSASFDLLLDGISQGLFSYDQNNSIILPADISFPNLTFIDALNNQCQNQQSIGPLFSCSTDCEIIINNLTFDCQDNGTTTDPTDDFYIVEFNASGVNNSPFNTFGLIVDGTVQGVFSYDQNNTINLPADGSNSVLTFYDFNNEICQTQQQIGPLIPCSMECDLVVNNLTFNCQDNGSPSDPSDDFYTIEFNASGINNGGSTSFELLVDGISEGLFSYDQNNTINLPADGSSPIFTFFDNDNNQCQIQQTIGPLNTCSGVCIMDVLVSNIICDDAGTGEDDSDDTFTFDILVSGLNTSGNWVIPSQGFSGAFNVTTQIGPFLIASGGFILEIVDAADASCMTSAAIVPPAACSSCPGTVDAGAPATITCNNPTAALEGSSNSMGIFSWTDSQGGVVSNDLNGIATQGGWYFLTGTFSNNCVAVDSIFINEDIVMPVANAGSDQTLDCNNALAILDGSLSSSGVDYIYTWTNGGGAVISNEQSITVSSSGIFTLEVIDTTNGCVSILDAVEVFENLAAPIAAAGPDQIIDCITGQITIDGTIVPFDPTITYSWTDGFGQLITTNPILQTTDPGIYNLQLFNTVNGCFSALDEVEIFDQTQMPLAIIYTNPGNVIDCSITEVELSTEVEPNIVYSWQIAGETFVQNEIMVTAPGLINLMAIDTITGCSNANSINIDDFTAYPIVDIMPTDFISCDVQEIIIDGSNSQSGATINYTWYDGFGNTIMGATSNSLTVDIGGFYILEATDSNNDCTNSDTIFVDSFLDVPLSNPADDVMLPCLEVAATLDFPLLNPTADVEIIWSTTAGEIIDGQGTTTPQVMGVGMYFVSIEDNTSGCVLMDSLLVSNNPNVPEAIVAQVADESCLDGADGMISIQGVDGGEGPYAYTLNNEEINNTGNFSNLTPGNYSLLIEDNNGCATDTSFQITPGVQVDIQLPPIIELIENHADGLQALVNIPDNQIASISWSPNENLSCSDCLNPIVTGVADEEYVLTIVHENGCQATAMIQLLVRPDVEVYIPSAFSPNGDGSNEKFTLFGNERVENIESLLIFDRWGAVIFINENFDHSNLAFGWDGTHLDKPLNPGVFVYTFVVNYDDGRQVRFSGDVTLVR